MLSRFRLVIFCGSVCNVLLVSSCSCSFYCLFLVKYSVCVYWLSSFGVSSVIFMVRSKVLVALLVRFCVI